MPEPIRNKPQFSNMQRMELDEAFKEEEHPFRIAIVCAMWLTGFDVPSLSTARYIFRNYACEAPITNPNAVTAHRSRLVRL